LIRAVPQALRWSPDMALLEIDDLHIGFPTDNGVVELVRGLSFSVEAGEAIGLVGETG
jgi:ABC-type dipeptide/oligopeptide/nickel transport system ATPase component